MAWSVATAKDEGVWFQEYLDVALGEMPPEVPPRVQVFGNTMVRWWDGQPGDVIIMSEGGTHEDRHLAEQIVFDDLSRLGYRRASFTLNEASDMRKTADWQEVQQKAVRLKNAGQVTILRNGWNVLVANVIGDHGKYEVTISRDDPNSMAITQWTCECPWDQYAFNRTRKWKKYEGRCCSHVLAAFWQGQATPIDDYDPNQHGPYPRGQKGTQPTQQGELFDKSVGRQPSPPGAGQPTGEGATNEISTGGGVPKGVDRSEITDSGGGGGPLPGAPSIPGIPTAPSAPSAPTGPSMGQLPQVPKPSPSRGQGQSTNPTAGPTNTPQVAQPSDQFDVIPPAPDYGEQMQLPFSTPKGEDQTGGRNLHLPGALSKVVGKKFKHVRHAAHDLQPEEIVQLLPPRDAEDWNGEWGTAVGGAPGRGTGSPWLIGPNSVGKVFSYDKELDWATVHFPLHETGELQPYFVEIILPSSQLAPRPDLSDPFIGPR